jgi:hypothetical protein
MSQKNSQKLRQAIARATRVDRLREAVTRRVTDAKLRNAKIQSWQQRHQDLQGERGPFGEDGPKDRWPGSCPHGYPDRWACAVCKARSARGS